MGSFSRGLLSGVAIAGVFTALYERYQQTTRPDTCPCSETQDQRSNDAQSEVSDHFVYSDKESNLLRGSKILLHGIPHNGPKIRYYANHALQYDQFMKIPLWVAEHITESHVQGPANRKHSKFKPDPDLEALFSAQNSDYWKSGWSRGHMAPAGNNKHSQDAMDHTFYLSNVLPQNYENNAGFWNRLEMYCRDLTSKFKDVWIISGPLMIPYEEDGKKFIKYQVIGDSQVAVPTHLYKVIAVGQPKSTGADPSGNDDTTAMAAFIVPNSPLSYKHTLKEFQVPLELLESKTGIQFMRKVDRTKAPDLCRVDDCELMGREQFELYILTRRVQSANSLKKLEKIWSELESKGLTPDQHLKDLYAKKTEELSKDSS